MDKIMDNMTVEQLCKFAERVDNSFDIKNKNSQNAESLNVIKDHHRHVIKSILPVKTKRVLFVTPPVSPTKRIPIKSILKKRPWTPKYPRSPATTSANMTTTYRNQNQYKGQCAKCGKTGHSIC